MLRTYSELRSFPTFLERFEYLSLRGSVGRETFGFDRWMNQRFYTSVEWKKLRQLAVIRDNGCDLGVEGFEIHDKIIVHHMNALTVADIAEGSELAMDLEYLVCTTHDTHNAIHYGDATLLSKVYVPRAPGDTQLW